MEPRPASTVVLLRSGPEGPEALFVRRPDSMRFLGGFHAFPGGALAPDDQSEEAAALSALPAGAAGALLGDAAGEHSPLGFFVCALRELYEEVGILLAYRDDLLIADDPEVAGMRSRMLAGKIGFLEVVRELGARLATDRLKFHARWVAPEALPIRFDARVFLAAAAGRPDADPNEVDAVEWLTPGQALALAETGALRMAPPTVATVSSLARFNTVDAALRGEVASPAPKIERHSPLVRRLVAPNASLMTGPGSNTYLVGSDRMLVIDPGSMEPGHLEAVTGAGRVVTIAVTHGHPDHASGALELAERTGADLAAFRSTNALPPGAFTPLAEGDRVRADGAGLVVVETPGHASDHICLWFEEERALFSGDLVLGEGTTVISPPDGDLSAYLSSLDKTAALSPRRLYPGHFAPRDDAAEWIAWYVAHRREREEQVLEALGAGLGTPDQIVGRIYAAYPPSLHPIAARQVLAHLLKLEAEGRVTGEEGRFTLWG